MSGERGGEQGFEAVAVCFTGRLRALTRTLGLLQAHLLDALQPGGPSADIFIYGPTPTATELSLLAPLFEGPAPVRTVRFDDEADLYEALARDHHRTLRKAARLQGNWMAAGFSVLDPGGWGRLATGIRQMQSQRECLAMVVEREQRRGSRYDRLVFTRTDLRWIFPHPPLRFLSPGMVWIPDTTQDDFAGIYDRHLVMPRGFAEALLGSMSLLISGRADEMIIHYFGKESLRSNDTNTERWLAVRLLDARARVGRFPMPAYISCEPGERAVRVNGRDPTAFFRPFLCSVEEDFRYPPERESVLWFLRCAHDNGKEWTRKMVQSCYCPFADHEGIFPDALELCN